MEARAAALYTRLTTREIMSRMWRLYETFLFNWLKSMLHIAVHRYFLPNHMNVMFIEDTLFTTFYYLGTFDMRGGLTLIVAQFVCNFMLYEMKRIWGTALILALLMTWYPAFYSYMETKYMKISLSFSIQIFFNLRMTKNSSYIFFYLGCILYNYFQSDTPKSREDLNLAGVLLGCLMCVYLSRYEIHEVCFIAFLMCIWMSLKSQRVQQRHTFMRPDTLNVINNFE